MITRPPPSLPDDALRFLAGMQAPTWRDTLLRAIIETLQVDAAGIHLASGESWVLSAGPIPSPRRLTLSRAAERLREMHLASDAPCWVEQDERLADLEFSAFGIQPLRAREITGGLWVLSQTPRSWNEAEKTLLARFAASIEQGPSAAGEASPGVEWLTDLHRHDEARFRTVFEASPLGMIVGDLQAQVFETNPAFKRIFWWFRGHVFDEAARCTDPEESAEDARLLGELIAGERDFYTFRKRYFRPDGTVLWCDLRTTLVRREDGSPHWLFLFIDDISEQLRREADLRSAHKMEALGRMAAGVAHEFRNALTAIQGNADLLRLSDPTPEDVQESAQAILTACRRVARLTGQLLLFTKNDPVHPQPIELNAAARACDALLVAQGESEPALEVVLDLHEEPLCVEMGAGRIEQILVNLVRNARDARPRDGRVRIVTRAAHLGRDGVPAGLPEGDYAVLSVQDRGEGIPEELLPLVCDPFVTTRGPGQGVGLGLSIVHGMVEQAGGRVIIESRPGAGTTVTLYLPRLAAS